MIKIKNQRGITIIGLVITIVIMLILTSVAINIGTEDVDYSKRVKFMSYMQAIQKKVDILAENGEYSELGQNINQLSSDKADKLKTIAQNENLSFAQIQYLPSEYQAVEYLAATGTQYINTKVPISTKKIEQYTEIQISKLNKRQLMGQNYGWWFGITAANYYEGNGTTTIMPSDDTYDTITYVTDYPGLKKTMIINGTSFEQTVTASSFTTGLNYSNKNIYVFNINNYSNASMTAKIKSYRIRINDELVLNLIPCYLKSGDETQRGFYDIVNKEFLTNSGSGNFGIGPNIELEEDIRYFDSNAIARDFGLDNIDDEIIVNFKTREVVSLNGIKYEGNRYYTQYNLPGGQKIVNNSNSRTVSFGEPTININGLNATFTIPDISITNGTLSYTTNSNPDDSDTIWTVITNHTVANEPLTTDYITKSGTYYFKLEDNTNKSNMYISSSPIYLRIVNSPQPKGYLEFENDTYDYSGQYLNANANWAYATENSVEYVWIPRFAYETSDTSNIEFLKGTSDLTTSGGYITNDWTVPSVFTDVTGVWVRTDSYSSDDIIDIINTGTTIQ